MPRISAVLCYQFALVALLLCGCKTSQQARNEVTPNTSPIRDCVTLSAECESLVVSIKERYKTTESPYIEARKLYLVAFPAQNGYVGGLIQVAQTKKQLKLESDDFVKSDANAKLQAFKASATNSLGAGISPILAPLIADGGVALATNIEARISDYNKRQIDEALSNLVTTLGQARIGSFDTVTADYLQKKYSAAAK